MKLYLSSFKLGNNPQQLSELFLENKKIAIIPNARESFETTNKSLRMQEEIDALQAIDLMPAIVDLNEYLGEEESLKKIMDTFGGVWVVGGNTFVLRVAMQESGFDTWLLTKARDKNFVYAGYSAGICVLAPTLKGLDIVDSPKEVQEVYRKGVIWEGLGILNYSFAPHYRSNHPESALVEKEVAYMKKNNMQYKTLQDGEVLILEV